MTVKAARLKEEALLEAGQQNFHVVEWLRELDYDYAEVKRLSDDLKERCEALHRNNGPIPRWAF